MQGEMNDAYGFFPASPRVIYEHSPLIEVVCQLRFPTILRIESEVPADFQDRIRGMYPVLSRQKSGGMGNIPPEVAKIIGVAGQQSQYTFESEDGAHAIVLAPDSIALTSHAYQRWENFRDFLQPAVDALVDVYKPAFFMRIGLRYQNAIVPSAVGMSGRPWADLISNNILGELSHSFGDGRLEEAHRHLRIRSKDEREGFLLQHGIGQHAVTSEDAYVFDIDFYTDKKAEIVDAVSFLERFNYRAGRAFRWCISDELHHALHPTELGDVDGG